jgi:FdrA protein
MNVQVELRHGTYHDSVTLMAASQAVAGSPGVDAAIVAMATELNLDLYERLGFDPGQAASATPDDLLVAVRAEDETALKDALAALDRQLRAVAPPHAQGFGEVPPPRTVVSALRWVAGHRDWGPVPGTDGSPAGAAPPRGGGPLALVSVPGEHAFVEAMDAIRAGASVMVFSDNVPLAQEIALKDAAAARGVLVLGPDAGTAVVGGVGLGFANALRRGPVGIVAASGTGAQQVTCLLDDAGVGVSAVLGVGGRDLSAEVAGRSALAALRLLDEHPGTELVALLSKPPDPAVAARLRAAAGELRTPSVVAFTGRGQADLTEVAAGIAAAADARPVTPAEWPAPQPRAPRPGFIRGLFSGGTLCDEAMAIAAGTLGPVASNIPLEPEWALGDDLRAPGHLMIDFGDDRLTRGRPHPMIDPSLRLERIAAEAADPACSVLLLDVVLGFGAHPDPAGALAPAIAAARETARAGGRDLAVVVSLIGSRADPQGRDATAGALAAAGASVHASNAAAARAAVTLALGAGQ